MASCPYCNAEIEDGLAACPACGRYLAVEEVSLEKFGPAGERFRQSWAGQQRIVFHRIGCGCCSVRFFLLLCLVLGFWRRHFWYMAAFLLVLELSSMLRRK